MRTIGFMPRYLVTVRGDPARAAELLALAGIENVVAGPSDSHLPGRRVTARLPAASAELAEMSVRAALMDEAFMVERARVNRLFDLGPYEGSAHS